MRRSRLAEFVGELGFTCRITLDSSSRVCAKCASKIRNATDLMRFLESAFNVAVQNRPSSIEYSPMAVKRFNRMLSRSQKVDVPSRMLMEFLRKKFEMKSVTSCRWRIEKFKKPK